MQILYSVKLLLVFSGYLYMKERLRKQIDLLSIILFCLKMSAGSQQSQLRKYFILNILLSIFSVALPFAIIFLTSQIIGLLSGVFLSGTNNEPILFFIVLCVATLVVGLSLKIIDNFKVYCERMHSDILNNHIRIKMMEKAASLDACLFDSPNYYNEMRDASGNAPLIAQTAFFTFDFLRFAIQFIISIIFMSMFSKLFALLLAVSVIPNVIFQRKQYSNLYDLQRRMMNDERKLSYLSDVLFLRSYMKDVRLFNLFPFINAKFRSIWDMIFTKKKKLSFKYTVLVAVSTFLPEFILLVFMINLGMGVFRNAYTVGDYSYFYGIAGQVLGSAYLTISNYSHIMDGKLRIKNYLKFMSWENKITDDGYIVYKSDIVNIEFKNVSFRYDKNLPLVLDNISFTVSSPYKTAIVGVNGSGKSTIFKLMMRLYDPDEGEILLNGINLRRYTLASVRKCFSAMIQDYSCYAFNVRESVSLSDYDKSDNEERIYDSLIKSGAQSFVSKLDNGIETFLTRQYDEAGVELSGGEWQKISAARMFYREAPIILLDEPSSALDPESEDILFKQLEEVCAEKCTVLISHRLSNVVTADYILVLENGNIVERGSYTELMAINRTFARLFNVQSQKYKL